MSDDVLRRNLRAVDSAMRPNPVFVDDLHARLTAELGFEALPRPAAKVRVPARPQFRRGARLGWLAVAALLVLALLALLLAQVGRTPDEPPPPPTGSPSSQPSAPPSSQPSGASSPQGSTAPAIADSSPALDNLRSDGLVLYESGAMDGIPRLRVLRPDLSSVELLPDVPGLQFGAAWRPDGERLAFTSYDAVELRSHPLIWETDAEGVEPILLSEGCDLPTCVAEYEPSYIARWHPSSVRPHPGSGRGRRGVGRRDTRPGDRCRHRAQRHQPATPRGGESPSTLVARRSDHRLWSLGVRGVRLPG